jgi:hypothetical protein
MNATIFLEAFRTWMLLDDVSVAVLGITDMKSWTALQCSGFESRVALDLSAVLLES